ncbi:MAG: tetratricopeptide repeat protein [Candidatus Cloacimonetes bacterium]|nr:tetratricopeptide repeat protein [Candidatus Cloacimonadota bacterium]
MESAIIIGACVFLLTLILNLSKRHKPLYTDDGNWFYSAAFAKYGRKLYHYNDTIEDDIFDLLRPYGYFTLDWLAGKFHYHSWPLPTYLQWFKIVYYSLNSAALFFTGFFLFDSLIVGVTAGMVFALATFLGQVTYSDVTYAEWYLILPLCLAIVSLKTGQDSLLMFALAGVFCGWAFQMKLTSIAFALIIPLVFLSQAWLLQLTVYWAAILLLTFLPVLLISLSSSQKKRLVIGYYLKNTFIPFLYTALLIMQRMKLIRIKEGTTADNLVTEQGVYTKAKWEASNTLQKEFEKLTALIRPYWAAFDFLFVMAIASWAHLFIDFNRYILLMLMLFVTNIALVIVQKNYYRPKINTMWLPVSISVGYAVSIVSQNLMGNFFILVFAAVYIIALSARFRGNLSTSRRSQLNDFNENIQGLFTLCKRIGRYIQENSQERDKLLVWGNYSNILLYADREAYMPVYPFLFPNNTLLRSDILARAVKNKTAPEYIQIFDYKLKKRWSIDKIQSLIGAPYRLKKNFTFSDGKSHNFPLYERIDDVYKQILHAQIENHDTDEATRKRTLMKLTNVDADDCELNIVRATAGMDSERQILHLQELLGSTDSDSEATVARNMLGRLFYRAGQFEETLKLLSASPADDFRNYLALGEVAFLMGDLSAAKSCFEQALKINPLSAEAYNNLGVYFNQQKKYNESISCFKTALALKPDFAEAKENLNCVAAVGA